MQVLMRHREVYRCRFFETGMYEIMRVFSSGRYEHQDEGNTARRRE
jgi:hypothetical protein